jgi:Leucine-rich repeat (LRR) protein
MSNLEMIRLTEEKWTKLDKNQKYDNITELYANGIKISSLDVNPFDSFVNLEHLDLRENQIERIKKEHFQSISRTLTHLFLSKNKISSLDENTFDSFVKLTKLDLSDNQIEILKKKHFQSISRTLTQLDLAQNKISSLDENTFDSFVNLTKLDLRDNQIERIKKEHFQSINRTLTHLFLSKNKISSLDVNTFDSFEKLDWLDLSDNQIEILKKEHFQSINRTLTRLFLSKNKISSLDENTFDSFVKLTKLDLRDNQIEIIKKEHFQSISRTLTQLDLAKNKISSLDENTFDSFVKLTKLDLRENQIERIKKEHFQSINRTLTQLDLSKNKISSLDENTFDSFVKLDWLDLRDNQIEIIKKEHFQSINRTLTHLFLSKNKISSLDVNLFDSFVKLDWLDLRENQIERIKKEHFQSISRTLTHLFLSKNKISSLDVNTFDSFEKLDWLDLSDNQIEILKKEHFQSISRTLTQLDLAQNKIASLDENTFDSFEKLDWLDLRDNQIEIIKKEHFQSISRTLTQLDLSKNKISSLDENTFDSFVKLITLDLSSNCLSFDNFSLLSKIISLESCYLGNNRLKFIDINNILKLKSLKILDLSSNLISELKSIPNYTIFGSDLEEFFLNFNQINKIDNGFFSKYFPRLKRLELIGNKLNRFEINDLGDQDIVLSLGKNNLINEPIPQHISVVENFQLNSPQGYIYELDLTSEILGFNHMSKLKWDNIKMFSVITGANGMGKTSILQIIKSLLEKVYSTNGKIVDSAFPIKSSLFDDDEYVFPLFLKHVNAPVSIYCVDENNMINVFSGFLDPILHTLDFYEFYFCFTQKPGALLKKGASILSFRSLEMCLNFLKSEILNEKLRTLLDEHKFKYDIKWSNETNEFIFDTMSSNHKTSLKNLSPGEQLILLFILWKYIYSHFKVNGKTILLFDEPDAHLNPEAVKQFLDVIKDLVELGIQVIMTTHNPITVSLVPNEHLFKLEFINNLGERKLVMNKVESKYDVFKLLTDNLAFVSEPIRLVFTEGNGMLDNLFYNQIKAFYNENFSKFDSSHERMPFIFRSMGSKDFKHFFNKKLKENESKSEAEVEAVYQMHFGITDGDYNIKKSFDYFTKIYKNSNFKDLFITDPKKKGECCFHGELKLYNKHLLRLERYAIENFIHDPINLFFSLKEIQDKNKLKEINTFLRIDSGSKDYQLDSIDTFLNRSELDKGQKGEILNKIIKSISNAIIDEMLEIFKYSGPDKKIVDLKKTLGLTGFKEAFGFKSEEEMLEESKNMPGYEVDMIYNIKERITLNYNPILMFLKGHALAAVFNSKIQFKPFRREMSQDQVKLELMLKKENGFVFTEDLYDIIEFLSKK